jgi:ATP-dependent DNA helicase RecG
MEYINNILQRINICIESNTFVDVERSNIELKDLTTGNEWNSLKETICAFLNTNGGYIICGVRERDKKYIFKTFGRNNESNLVDLQNKFFKNDNDVVLDLSDYITFDYINFRDGEIALITVRALSDDLKFVKFKTKYFERKLTGDYEISENRVKQHIEYKKDAENSKEIAVVENAQLNDLDLNKINNFILLLNQSSRKESIKPSLIKSKQFLENRHFIKTDKITTLGMLICGNDPFQFLENRCEVDCYYDSSSSISKDGKDFQGDVLSLMDDALRFVWGHIRTGKTIDEGGKSLPEYPEELVREMINNSLAHRDYTINKFVTINVEPGKYLQVKNPGAFKENIKITSNNQDIPIRRLIPGIPESKNPKLASILKAYDKIESQGRGMASLVNYALTNKVDISYYELMDNSTISLTIPSGKLLDEETESWINSFERYIIKKLKNTISFEHKIVLAYFRKSELLNRRRYYTILLSESNNHYNIIEELKTANLIYEHPSSTENIIVYVLDRELMKSNFNNELIELIGNEFIDYDVTIKNILNVLYRYSKYNEMPVKPAKITPEIYFMENGKKINPQKYESLGRRIRGICTKLSEKNILLIKEKNEFLVNFNYKTTDLFS